MRCDNMSDCDWISPHRFRDLLDCLFSNSNGIHAWPIGNFFFFFYVAMDILLGDQE